MTTLDISAAGDDANARHAVRHLAQEIGFDANTIEMLAIAVSEMATNLIRHTHGGTLTLTALNEGGRSGLQIEARDFGAGIADFDTAMQDGYSTCSSMGDGLGAINRLMDEMEFTVNRDADGSNYLVVRRWLRPASLRSQWLECPLCFGVASRPHKNMLENGDTFLIKTWNNSALVGVIDGLGHGAFAAHAAQTARAYVEEHYDQPLGYIFRGTNRACLGTRGVVMALARFDWDDLPDIRLTFSCIGNIEARILNSAEPIFLNMRRGVLGGQSPPPLIVEIPWKMGYLLVLHSDGISTHWNWQDYTYLSQISVNEAAHEFLNALAKDNDDATVMLVRSRER